MTDHKWITIATLACAMLVAIPVASAQNPTADWQGQDSEFGSIRAPFMVSMEGERVPVEAHVVLRENYEEKDSRYYMFGFLKTGTPLDVQLDQVVRMDTQETLTCAKTEQDDTGDKCFVDLRNMPPAGIEIRMYGTVGSSAKGGHQMGAIVVPFTYDWMRVQMSNGLNAELYASTQVNVQDCPGGCDTIRGRTAAIPGLGAIGIIAAGTIAIGLLALRRR